MLERLPYFACKSWLGIFFQEACDSSRNLLTQAILSALFHDLKITHFQSAIFLFLLILGSFPAQIKLKIRLFISRIYNDMGQGGTDAEQITLDIPSV